MTCQIPLACWAAPDPIKRSQIVEARPCGRLAEASSSATSHDHAGAEKTSHAYTKCRPSCQRKSQRCFPSTLLTLLCAACIFAAPLASAQDGGNDVDDHCKIARNVRVVEPTLHVAFVVMGSTETALIDTALRSLLYHRSCPMHIHLVLDSATKDTDWVWLSQYDALWYDTYLTGFEPEAVLRDDTFQRWGSSISPEGDPVAWPREVLPSRFAKLSLDSIITDGPEDLLYLDNDVVLVDDICKAHSQFAAMSPTALFGLSPQMSDLYTRKQTPYAYQVGPDDRWNNHPGVNSGVIFWKLARASLHGWSQDQYWLHNLEKAMDTYTFELLDQDLWNYVGSEHPELIQVMPLRWNVQLVWFKCTANDRDAASNLVDNVNADIMVVHGNARHFKIHGWFSHHVWFPFAHPTVLQYGEAYKYHQDSQSLCNARAHMQQNIKDHLSHCSWLV